ncbi:helix-turn-helix transcriptional regulator [Tellurirhabdus bombi]|uniref:helix-turn-helix transcriptional regulator n=1 Tax=Tellurirhabdus bombi TaxID=2907205 RepID=UPI001F178DBE|nr:WYL domain-containing protein [Tellurirhabdus bombi]
MPANRNALIRYKIIDNCLRNRYRQWTLEALIDCVSEALYEYEGMEKGISRRTIQADLQMMRSDKLGYNAPILVIDRKYYTYADPAYSITQTPLTNQDLSRMNEAVEMLKQFKGFSHFQELNEVIQKLEAHVHAATVRQTSVIDFEKNDGLKGLSYLDQIYQAIIQKKVLFLTYQSFKARQSSQFHFHAWWLKEFKNRWFVVGIQANKSEIMHLALDRILSLKLAEEPEFLANDAFSPDSYYQHVIGVTVSPRMRPQCVRILVSLQHAPYVETKPLHPSQQLIERREDGIVIEICVQLNLELEKEILGFGEGMTVLAPASLRARIQARLATAARFYEQP